MLNKLNEKYPLPRAIGWGKVMTGLILLIFSSVMWFTWAEVKLAYQVHHTVPQQVAENRSDMQQAMKKLDRILELVKKSELRDLTTTGKVKIVHDNDTNHMSACIWLNEIGPAAIHIDREKVKLTNLDDPSHRSGILRIRGTISVADQDCIGEICGVAAAMLHAGDLSSIHVKLEPVLDADGDGFE